MAERSEIENSKRELQLERTIIEGSDENIETYPEERQQPPDFVYSKF